MSIQLLDEGTINKIAAGEVIERPASIVKELTENAIDADASVITIEIRDGGISMIRVTDNGGGIPADEVKTAFLRHATSKIQRAEDILHVRSLGFRGEALASISAVSRIELITRQRDALTGVRYAAEGGRETVFEEVGAPGGTTVITRDLFFNTPVRRSFLKAAVTETAHVAALAEELALSHPEISIRFLANGQSRFHTSGNREVKDIIYQLYGREIASKLLPVSRTEQGFSVQGFIGRPEISRGSRALEHYCVNGRYIKSPLLAKAIEDGYGDRMMQHNFPFAVLFLEIDPETVDVNVHPTKREVRFSDTQACYLFLRSAVEDALQRAELIRLSSLQEENKKKTAQSAGLGRDSVSQEEVRTEARPQHRKPPEPFEPERLQEERKREAEEQALSLSSFLSAYGQRQMNQSAKAVNTESTESNENRATQNPALVTAERELLPERKAVAEEKPAFETVERGGQYALFRPEERKNLRLIGAAFDTYWIAERGNSLYLIDQHAAHEKVNYERLLAAYRKQELSSQRLEPPLLITLSAEEQAVLESERESFEKIGFSIEHFGGSSYAVRAVPNILPSVLKEELLKTMFASLIEGQRADDVPLLIIEKTASMSCKAAIKGNQHISLSEAEALLDELFSLENPYNCPHGRPTIIELTKTELDGEIISADSMQVYRGMDIGTAKIQREEMQGIPHHLIDILEPEENFDAMQFQQRAAAAIADIQARGKVPILVGGTGFYLQTVLYDVPFSEESRDEAVHAALAARRAREGMAALYAELTRVDPEAAAKIHPNNEKRVLRALEYYLSSGDKISLHNAAARERRSPYRLFYFVLNMDRASLYRRIDARVEAMFEAGLVEEVRTLALRGVPRTATSMQGIGYHELFPYLDGEAELSVCKEQVKTDTRHFAKRQLTWFRRERDARWFMREDYASEEAILEDMLRRVCDRREDTE